MPALYDFISKLIFLLEALLCDVRIFLGVLKLED